MERRALATSWMARLQGCVHPHVVVEGWGLSLSSPASGMTSLTSLTTMALLLLLPRRRRGT